MVNATSSLQLMPQWLIPGCCHSNNKVSQISKFGSFTMILTSQHVGKHNDLEMLSTVYALLGEAKRSQQEAVQLGCEASCNCFLTTFSKSSSPTPLKAFPKQSLLHEKGTMCRSQFKITDRRCDDEQNNALVGLRSLRRRKDPSSYLDFLHVRPPHTPLLQLVDKHKKRRSCVESWPILSPITVVQNDYLLPPKPLVNRKRVGHYGLPTLH